LNLGGLRTPRGLRSAGDFRCPGHVRLTIPTRSHCSRAWVWFIREHSGGRGVGGAPRSGTRRVMEPVDEAPRE
jgi:hypothetical protein